MIKYCIIYLIVFAVFSCGNQTGKNNSTSEKPTDELKTEDDGFTTIFDGKSLDNWKSDGIHWRAENGNIVGEVTESTPLEANTFLIYDGGEVADFELIAEFKITESGNSGIQYRSDLLEDVPFALRGYQADIDGKNSYTGQNYEERKRATLAYRGQVTIVNGQENAEAPVRDNVKNNAWQSTEVTDTLGSADELKENIKSEDWNEIHLVVKGNQLRHYVNGVLMSYVTDNDSINSKFSGLLGLQVHKGPPMKVEYRNIRLKKL